MEKTIYIPGDLVMTNGIPIGTKKGIVYQVTESNADKYAKVKDGNAFTELKGSVTLSNLKGKTIKDDGFLFADSGAWVKDIVPIPLTRDILLKNGWKFCRDSLLLKIDDNVTLGIVFAFDHKVCYIRATNDIIHKEQSFARLGISNVDFVSDLQHILYSFHLNSEMEV